MVHLSLFSNSLPGVRTFNETVQNCLTVCLGKINHENKIEGN